jgi:O-antigen/teichoic acid export membrane protein
MTSAVGDKIVRNTAVVFVGRLWFVVLSLALTPYLLSGLGRELYGVWVLVDAVGRTISLLDFGFGTSFVKYVAEYDARGDRSGISAVFSAGLVFYAGFAIVLGCVAFVAVAPIFGFLTVAPELAPRAHAALRVAIFASVCANFMAVFQSVVNGLQRMHVTNAIMAGISLAFAIGCVIAIEGGFGVLGVAVSQLVTQVIGIAVSVYYARRAVPDLHFSADGVRREWRRLFGYGLNVYLSNVAAIVNTNFDKFLVSRFLDTTHVAYYDVGTRGPATARSFAVVTLSALTPAAAEIEVREGREGLYELFERASRWVALVAFPLFVGVAVAGRPILGAWVGPGYDAALPVLAILSVGHLCYSVAGPVSPFVQGMGWPQCQRNAETLSLVANVVLSSALVVTFGFLGAPLGTSIAMSIASFYYLFTFHRLVDRPLGAFLRRIVVKPAACALLAAAGAGLVENALGAHAAEGRLAAFGVMLAVGASFAAVYGVAIYKSGFFGAEETGQLRRYLSSIVSGKRVDEGEH